MSSSVCEGDPDLPAGELRLLLRANTHRASRIRRCRRGETFPNFSPVLRIRDVYSGSAFVPSRIQFFSIPDTGSKNLSILTQKIDSKLSEI
jgi:hypothetical protein